MGNKQKKFTELQEYIQNLNFYLLQTSTVLIQQRAERTARQKISKYLEDLDNTITQQNLGDFSIYHFSK